MYHMRKATVRQLRCEFGEISASCNWARKSKSPNAGDWSLASFQRTNSLRQNFRTSAHACVPSTGTRCLPSAALSWWVKIGTAI